MTCPICGRDFDLVDGDNPIGTESLNKHFGEFKCNVQMFQPDNGDSRVQDPQPVDSEPGDS